MSIAEPNPGPLPSREPFGYAFAGVTLELARGRLLVDGADSAAGPLILKLLAVLCRSPGLLVSRQQLFDAIWPRQTVSDEALTKLIARLRETLGPYGKSVVTLRGRGVRLDAVVTVLLASPEAEQAPVSAPVPALDSEAANEPVAAQPAAVTLAPVRGSPSVWFGVATALALGMLLWMSLRSVSPPPPVSGGDAFLLSGFGITMSDVQSAKPETRDMLREAGAAMDKGEVERAMTLLQVAHESDPSTPVPGAMLAYMRSRKLVSVDPVFEQEVAARLDDSATPYVHLLVRLSRDAFARIDNGEPTMLAMVAMRPSAWRLQMKLAHQALSRRRDAVALTALRAIPSEGIAAQLIVVALADRAALGDSDAVARELDEGALSSASPEFLDLLRGRLAWTANRPDAAIVLMDEATRLAGGSNNAWVEINARLHAALFAFQGGRADADVRLEQTASLIRRTTTLETHLAEIEALLAQLLIERGETDAASDLLLQAAKRDMTYHHHAALEVFNARLGMPTPAGTFLAEAQKTALRANGDRSAVELADAWVAHARGDKLETRRFLDQAKLAGIDNTYLREDAAALDALLRGTTSNCRPDPPYPNLLRFSTCRVSATPR